MNADEIARLVREVPDFPIPGVRFKDITPVLADPTALVAVVRLMADPYRDAGVTAVAGIEARGFVLATPVAAELDAGFIPLRKPGKLPYDTVSESYDLEYGADALEIHSDAVRPGDKVLLVDDVIATGGTAAAGARLLRTIGADVVGLSLFIELAFLNGRDALEDLDVTAVLVYD